MLCCAVLCCTLLCCAVLCYAVLCCAVLCCAVLYLVIEPPPVFSSQPRRAAQGRCTLNVAQPAQRPATMMSYSPPVMKRVLTVVTVHKGLSTADTRVWIKVSVRVNTRTTSILQAAQSEMAVGLGKLWVTCIRL